MSTNDRSSLSKVFGHGPECGAKKEIAAEFYRKIVFSGGMVHLMLGLSLGILWTVGTPLVFHLELVAGSCFLLSGIVGIITGRLNYRFLDFATMATGILSALSCVVLFAITIHIISLKEKRVLTNPWIGIFIIYAALGFAFAAMLTFYAYQAIRAAKFSTSFRRRSSNGTSETPATKVTLTIDNENGANNSQRLIVRGESSSTTTASNDVKSKRRNSILFKSNEC